MMSFELLVWLLVAVTVVATAALLVGRQMYTFYTDEAVATLRKAAEAHPELQLVGWEPTLAGDWDGCRVYLRVILDHGAAERFEYRTGAMTRIEIEVPAAGESAPEHIPPIPDEQLPEAEAIAPPEVTWARLFAAPMGMVFEMEGRPESVDDCVELLDRLVAVAATGDCSGVGDSE